MRSDAGRSTRPWASISALVALLAIGAYSRPAAALSLSLSSTEAPYPGVTLKQYRTSSPTTDVWVAEVDLCAANIHVDATRAPSSTVSTGAWAADWGVQLALNGDFYKTGPVRVYGDAVGSGVRWPLNQTGLDSAYSAEWYYRDYGWFAFGPDRVDYTHTKWVKDNAATFGGALAGWSPTTVAPTPPDDTLALISGFPALVVEGAQVTCTSATASTCFPDRSDMRARHPRSAIGLTADQQTLLLVVVDGRTSRASGMYGAELADLMAQLGAWQAFNLDGGGSAQMWLEDRGYANNVSGNNSGSGTRSVANHIGVYTDGAAARGSRPGHCAAEPPCQVIPPAGGELDDAGACFQGLGSPEYWRTERVGYGGSLRWTNAYRASAPDNWSWFRIHPEEAGEYLVEWHAVAEFSVHTAVRAVLRADGVDHALTVNQRGLDGWQPLGTFSFAAGGDQYYAIYDDMPGTVASNQHMVSDGLRLTRVGAWCGNGACDGEEDCGACASDCTGPEELPANGIDDDCDGRVDEPAVPIDTGTGGDTALSGDGAADSTADDGASDGGTASDGASEGASDGAASDGGASGGAAADGSPDDTGSGGAPSAGLRIKDPGGCGGGLGLLVPGLFLGLPALRRRRQARAG